MCNLLPFIDWRLLLPREMGFFSTLMKFFTRTLNLFMSVAGECWHTQLWFFCCRCQNALNFFSFPFYCKLPQVQMTRKFVDEFVQLWELEEFRKFDSVSGDFKATRS